MGFMILPMAVALFCIGLTMQFYTDCASRSGFNFVAISRGRDRHHNRATVGTVCICMPDRRAYIARARVPTDDRRDARGNPRACQRRLRDRDSARWRPLRVCLLAHAIRHGRECA